MNFKNLIELMDYFKTEDDCVKYLYERRIKNNIPCHYCGAKCCSYLPNGSKRIRCRKCKALYSVRVGTVFQDSNIPLRKWFMAMYIYLSHKKGISSIQLAKDISVSQPTAWFMLHRLRNISRDFDNLKFEGTTEADEAYIGGSEANKHTCKKGKTDKTCIFGMINRDTKQVKAYAVSSNEKEVLLGKIYQNVKDGSTIFTDSYNGYDDLNKYYNHEFVKHCAGEYNRDKKDDSGRTAYKINTNSIEGFWSQLKRGLYGVYHWASKKHIQMYVNEFCYRYNTRALADFERFNELLLRIESRTLKYSCLIGN